jgi:hypothetical protein
LTKKYAVGYRAIFDGTYFVNAESTEDAEQKALDAFEADCLNFIENNDRDELEIDFIEESDVN